MLMMTDKITDTRVVGLASDVVNVLGASLIGAEVLTEAVGGWPGGLATVVELHPDPTAPEIVCNVESEHGRVGIFEHEWLEAMSQSQETPND